MDEIVITNAVGICADGLSEDNSIVRGKSFYFGKIDKEFPEIDDEKYNLRCNRILKYLADKMDLSGYEKDDIAVVIGTTNSGIEEFETSDNKHHAELGNPAEFLQKYLGLNNYAASVSTACTSGIKAFAAARRLLENDVCKAVIAGGIDTLASMPIYGFDALEVLSHEKTNPFSKNRSGICIGEAGALFLLEKNKDGIKIMGIGETSDAYHSATPDPQGVQAAEAIQIALEDAGLMPKDIDYINLHGTGTISNDLMEANAVYKVFGSGVPASSTKPVTGHCLGAAASIETFICYEILKGLRGIPEHIYDGEYDESLPKINLAGKNFASNDVKVCMCNAFGFGGTNAVLVLGK